MGRQRAAATLKADHLFPSGDSGCRKTTGTKSPRGRLETSLMAAVLTGLWCLVLCVGSAMAADSHRLAFSERDGVEVFTGKDRAGKWCRPDLSLTLALKQGSPLATAGIGPFLPKLTPILALECPAAEKATVDVLGPDHKKVGDGYTLAKATGWAPVPIAASNPAPRAGEPAAATYKVLLRKYLAARPALADDHAFVEQYTKFTRCEEWQKLNRNEFRYGDFLKETQGRFKAEIAQPVGTLFKISTTALFGEYQFETGEFVFRPFEEGAGFPAVDFDLKSYFQSVHGSCIPTDQRWPAHIFLRIANPWVIDGLPMSKDEARKLVDRNPRAYKRELGVNLTLRIDTIQDAKGVAAPWYQGHAEAEAMAEIVAVTVDDGAFKAPKILWSMDDTYRKERTARVERQKASVVTETAARNAGSVEATSERVQAYVDRFAKLAAIETPTIRTDEPTLRLAVRIGTRLKTEAGEAAFLIAKAKTLDVDLDGHTSYTLTGSKVALRLANTAEFAGMTIPKDIRDFAENRMLDVDATLFLRPTGYVDDPYLGTFLMNHIARVEMVFRKSGNRGGKSWIVDSKEEPRPFNPLADQRTARDFEVLGIRGGMAPDDVRRIVEKELGQKLAFDEKAMTLSSPKPECELDFDSNKTPPGRKCFKAEFRVSEKGLFGNKLGLARAIYRQALYKKDEAGLMAVVKEKYGSPVQEFHSYDAISPQAALRDEGTWKAILEWGKREATDRQGMPTQRFQVPVHALEAEVATAGDMAHLALTLTDVLFTNEMAAATAEEAARKAEEEKKRKAGVKL